MKIEVVTIDDKKYILENIIQLSIVQTYGVACDSLSVKFKTDKKFGEIVKVKVYKKDELIFNGYCDNQRSTADKNGIIHYFYARSSACLLVDSKTQPYTYNCPTTTQLYINCARELGFENALPDIFSNNKYEVSIGSSCFGAINNFVKLLTENEIYVDCCDRIKIYRESENVKSLNRYKVIVETAVINRSEPLSQINFKKTLSVDYNLHTKSELANDIGINRQRYVNLTSLPQWQREFTISRDLKKSFDNYKQLELSVKGYCDENVYQRFNFCGATGDYKDYILIEKKYTFDKNGEVTRLLLKKKNDVGVVTYVA